MKKIYRFLNLLAILLISNFSFSQSDTIVGWTFPNNPDDSLADVGIPANLNKIITTTSNGTIIYSAAGVTTYAVSNAGWDAGLDLKSWQIEFSTIGHNNILISSRQKSSNTGPKDFKIQYKLSNLGTWVDVAGGIVTVANDAFVVGTVSDLPLPIDCNNKDSVFLRWIMTTNTSVGNGTVASNGTSRMDNLFIKGTLNNADAEILTFNIPLQISSTINSGASTVDIVMPYGTNTTALIPTITTSTGATVSPLSGVVQDFTNPVVFTVTALDGITTKLWIATVTVEPISSVAEILTFDIPFQTSNTITSGSATIDVVMPLGTNVTALIPTITTSNYSTISPLSGVAQDFTNPVAYTVTAQDGTTKNWTVTVTTLPSTAAEILTFDITSQISSVVDSSLATVNIVMLYGTNVTTLSPTITLSNGATISPLSGVAQDFTNSVTYTVTAEDGITIKTWTVTVSFTPAPSNATEIITFDIASQISSIIDSVNATVNISFPLGTNVTSLIPTITVSLNSTISPLSGVTQDFTNPVLYTVTAEDGVTTKTWTASVTFIAVPETIVMWTFPNNPDDSIADGGITANVNKYITTNTHGTVDYANTGVTTYSARSTGWNDGMDSIYWETEFTTLGYKNITLTSAQKSSSTGPKDFIIQYKIGSLGNWTNVPLSSIIVANDWISGILPETNLPIETYNKESVYLRWIMTSNNSVGGGIVASTGTSRIDDIYIKGVQETLSNKAEIINFDIPNQVTSTIDSINSAILVVMPNGTNVTNLIPTITISSDATILPLSGAINDFTNTAIYTVTSQDGFNIKPWSVTVTVLTNTEIKNNNFDVLIYPNPTNSYVNISSKSNYNIEIVSIDGKLIFCDNINNSLIKINLNNYNSGVYFIKLLSKNKTIIKKLVIE